MRVRTILMIFAAVVLAGVAALVLLGPAHGKPGQNPHPTAAGTQRLPVPARCAEGDIVCSVEELSHTSDKATIRSILMKLGRYHITCIATPAKGVTCTKPKNGADAGEGWLFAPTSSDGGQP
jgi:hypothetical protein